MQVVIIRQAQRELSETPRALIEDLYALFSDLEAGKSLGLPISRPLPSIAKRLHELRLSYEGGEYRVFYVLRPGDAIYIVHAAQKKTQGLLNKTASLLKSRIKGLGL